MSSIKPNSFLHKINRLFVVVFSLFLPVLAVSAQENDKVKTPSPTHIIATGTSAPPSLTAGKQTITPTANLSSPASASSTKSSMIGPVDDYKKSLSELLGLYEKETQRLEQENSQLKDLYRDGLIARVVLEASDKSLAEARAKCETVRQQIAAADKPVTQIVADQYAVLPGASDQAWTTGNMKVDTLIRYYGNKYGVDSYLIYCLMSQESSFSSNATSSKGAQGLMQLMPGTAARYGVTNPYDMAQSIMGGTRYLKDLLQLFNGNIALALAGYNAGEGAVIKYNYTIPPYAETQNYVRLISARYLKGKPKTFTRPAF